jgi:hypothetical protein
MVGAPVSSVVYLEFTGTWSKAECAKSTLWQLLADAVSISAGPISFIDVSDR